MYFSFLRAIVENSKTIYDVVNSRRRKVARVYIESLRLQELRPFEILFFPFPFFYVYEERIFSAYHFHFTKMNIGQKIKGKMRKRKKFLAFSLKEVEIVTEKFRLFIRSM